MDEFHDLRPRVSVGFELLIAAVLVLATGWVLWGQA